MANRLVRNIAIACACACACALALVAVVALGLRLRAANHRQPAATSAQAATSQWHKPSPYGEAFVPPPIQGRTLHSTVGIGYFAGHPYPSVAPAVMEAKLIAAPPPSYPLLARIGHVRGQVTVQAVISSNGAVTAARALRGHQLLRGAAVAAVLRRRYRPYRIDGQPANVSTVVTVDFGDPS
jgi:TonB family protein